MSSWNGLSPNPEKDGYHLFRFFFKTKGKYVDFVWFWRSSTHTWIQNNVDNLITVQGSKMVEMKPGEEHLAPEYLHSLIPSTGDF